MVTFWGMKGQISYSAVAKLGFQTVFPFASGLWWYTTSYILFLLICPLLTNGLRRLNSQQHGMLAIGLLGLYSLVPPTFFGLNMEYSIVLFVYCYILMTWIRWHHASLSKNRTSACHLLIFGLLFGLGTQVIVQLLSPDRPIMTLWMNMPRCLPSLCIALALIILGTTAKPRYSHYINVVAASTLSVYLVETSTFGKTILLNILVPLPTGAGILGIGCLLAIALYCGVIAVDLVREWIYARTIDRNQSCQASYICDWLYEIAQRILRRIEVDNGQ